MTAVAPRERVQKRLARLGVDSRRAVERMVAQGRVRVDGRVAELGDKVDAASCITVDGRPLRARPAAPPRVIRYHKPEGELTTRKDPRGRPSVFAALPKIAGGRWVAVGRLDLNSRGLLLFTDDGDLANRLMHPRFGLEREYLCRVYGAVGDADLARLRAGVRSKGETLRFDAVRRRPAPAGAGKTAAGAGKTVAGAGKTAAGAGKTVAGAGKTTDGDAAGRNAWYAVVVTEGRNREVRRAWEAVGGRVSRLIRVRYGSVDLPKTLRPGEWQELPPAAIARLLQSGRPADRETTPAAAAKTAAAAAPAKTADTVQTAPGRAS
ncbi:MAG: pseudouridine synthase [Gammaproteobacteria bacterium]|nr:pseudouridine synthase [Gammaproteobacteria bacterium]